MNRWYRGVLFFIWISVSLYGNFLRGGGIQDNQKQQGIQYDAQAVLKLVSVRVLDLDGKPAMNLKQEDFILLDNGKEQVITEFEIHKLREYGEQQADYRDKNVIYSGKRIYFILIDLQGSDIIGAANSKEAAIHFVETKVKPQDEMCILSFSAMSGLIIQQYLTQDKDKAIKAIKKSKETRTFPGFTSGGILLTEERRVMARMAQKNAEAGGSIAYSSSGIVSSSARAELADSSPFGMGGVSVASPNMGKFGSKKPIDFQNCLKDLSKVMKYIPGNKSVLYFSSRSFGRQSGRLFAASNTPVFTVNSRRWKDRGIWSVGQRKAFQRAEDRLKEFAIASGGDYFPEVHNVEEIADKVDNLTANYYVLGYYVDEKWDGQYHKIDIKVKQEGYQTHVQEGYFNPKPYATLTDIEKKLHLYDLAFTDKPAALDPLKIQVEFLHGLDTSDKQKPGTIILSKMHLDDKVGVPRRNSELFTLIFDSDNKLVVSQRGEIDLSLMTEEFLFPYNLASLEPGEYVGRMIVRDMETGQASVGTSKITVPGQPGSGITLFSPLLLAPGDEAAYVRLSPEKKKDDFASLLSYFPLLPKNSSPVVGVLEEGMNRIWIIAPLLIQNYSNPEVDIKVSLVNRATNENIELVSDILNSQSFGNTDLDYLLLEADLPELTPGEYVLQLTAVETISGFGAKAGLPLIKK